MTRTPPPILLAIAAVVSFSVPAWAQEEKEKIELLLGRTPAPPNAIGYVNIESLNGLIGGSTIPRDVVQNIGEYWFIADLDVMQAQPKWEAGYATLRKPVTPEAIAKRVDGYVDEIEGQKVVWSPNHTYFVPGKKENRLGVLRPADRSLLAGWLSPSMYSNYSPFLEAKAKAPESYLSMMVAVELENLFSPVPIAEKIKDFRSLKSQQPETVAGILASIKGISMIVGRRGLDECIVTAEFGKSPAGIKLIAADLFAELLSRNGTAAPEVASWKVTASDNALKFQGPITEATLTGVMSVFSMQGQASRAASMLSDSDGSRSEKEQMAYRSKQYFEQINAIVDSTRKHHAQTTGALASWNDRRARQIDEMPTLNVDPDMVQYGNNVSSLLRGNAIAVRQTNIAAGKIKASESLNRGSYYGDGYGYYDPNTTTDYQRVTSAYARGNAYSNYRDALNKIDQLTVQTRQAMTDKYQIQF